MYDQLPADIDLSSLDYDTIATLTGMASSGNNLPTTKLNHVSEIKVQDQWYDVPAGSFAVPYEGSTVYIKCSDLKFRPLIRQYQYLLVMPKDGGGFELVNQTTMEGNFQGEFLDVKGGIKCGRNLPRSEWDNLPEDHKKRLENVKCMNFLFGVVSGKAVKPTVADVKAEEVVLDNYPVMADFHGANYMAPEEALGALMAAKIPLHQALLTANKPRKEKNGQVTYFIHELVTDISDLQPYTPEIDEIFKKFFQHIIEHNRRIKKEHDSALVRNQSGAVDDQVADAVAGDIDLSLDTGND